MSQSRTSEILCRMAQIRSDLDDDVVEIVENARNLADWRHYWRTYPWACLAATAAVGYLLVPAKPQLLRLGIEQLAPLVRRGKVVVEPEIARPGLAAAVLGWATRAAVRGAIGYATQSMARGAWRPTHSAGHSGNGSPKPGRNEE